MKPKHGFAISCTSAVLCALLMGGSSRRLGQAQPSANEAPWIAARTNNSEVGAQLDALDQVAWGEFASLVHPLTIGSANSQKPPEWVSWSNKCDAGLVAACQNTHTPINPQLPADESSAEIPRQILAQFSASGSSERQKEVVTRYAHSPQLASVLFNPAAANSIRRDNLGNADMLNFAVEQLNEKGLSGSTRRLPEGTFELGSEIVKLIWEIIPATNTASLRLYDSENKPVEPGNPQLYPEADWIPRYSINPDLTAPCRGLLPAYGTKTIAVAVSINCFYWFQIKGGGGFLQ